MFLARIVIPRSRSWSFESRMQSWTSWLARNWPDWRSIASTSVVLPWSTWAMIATFRMSLRRFMRVESAQERGGPCLLRRERTASAADGLSILLILPAEPLDGKVGIVVPTVKIAQDGRQDTVGQAARLPSRMDSIKI